MAVEGASGEDPVAARGRWLVAHVAARAVPLHGGVETHVARVAPLLAEAGYRVEVLSTDPGSTLARDEVVDGVRVRRWRAYPAGRDWYASPGLVAHLVRR